MTLWVVIELAEARAQMRANVAGTGVDTTLSRHRNANATQEFDVA